VPIYYNLKNTGRPYTTEKLKYVSRYLATPNTPLYPFGYGLSYTQFSYSGIELDRSEILPGESLTATVTVTNTGDYDGEEVVQLYIQDLVGSVTRPVKQLKGFRKIRLGQGESRQVSFVLSEADLAFYRYDRTWGAEPGEFRLYIGGSSEDVRAAAFALLPAASASGGR
jgi:beta-glucosidase